jgi:hypothetical protein
MHNLDYKLEDASIIGVKILTTGTLTIKIYRREIKYDARTGFDAYILKNGKSPRFPNLTASKWFPLLRKIEKLGGAKLK